jgi:hypothetical protein
MRKKSGKLLHLHSLKKYLGINITKGMNDIYDEKCKSLKKTLEDGKTSRVHELAEIIS